MYRNFFYVIYNYEELIDISLFLPIFKENYFDESSHY